MFYSNRCCSLCVVRSKISVTVNCWFCSQNSSVPYSSSNSWDCTFCEQYNGFRPVCVTTQTNIMHMEVILVSVQHSFSVNAVNEQITYLASSGACLVRPATMSSTSVQLILPGRNLYDDSRELKFKKRLQQFKFVASFSRVRKNISDSLCCN